MARAFDELPLTEIIALRLPQPYSEFALMELAARNPRYQIEQSSGGNLTLTPPTAASGNEGELELALQTRSWNQKTHFGKVGAISAGIRLPNGGDYIPDVYVVPKHTWDALGAEAREVAGYVPVRPIAVFELLSPGNKTATGWTAAFKEKLEDYERSAIPLVVLLDPASRTTIVRRPESAAQTSSSKPLRFDELPGLELDVDAVFSAIG